ncbi:MAG: PASTA domain-containing protein [Bacteroidetes bacterium]|nr:PASTA domain-containing protein [Bacteroidota bacterium]
MTTGERIRWIGPVLKSGRFWLGLASAAAAFCLCLLLLNYAVMPLWTRHDAVVTVPEIRQMPMEEAEAMLRRIGLRAELRELPFNPNIPADIVVDQNPLPNTTVKPGRRIYYYVNASPKEMVTVPDVTTRSEGVARNDILHAELTVGDVLTDTLHNPYEGTVTRQTPQGGHAVPKGTRVTLWLSPGLGREMKRVPDITGLPPAEARRVIIESGLWADSPDARGDTVRWQEPGVGNRLREGSEVRIHTTNPPKPPEVVEPEPVPQVDSAQTPTPAPEPTDTTATPEEAPVEPDSIEIPPRIPPELPPIEPLPPADPPEIPPVDDDGGDPANDDGDDGGGEGDDGGG